MNNSDSRSLRQAYITLALATLSFVVCFASWVLNGTLVTYLVTNQIFSFTESQIGWLLGAPVLTGSLSRVPLGFLTDRYGGRAVFSLLMLVSGAAMYLLSTATSFIDFLAYSFAFGIVGGSFAVGIGYVSTWFDKGRQGTALGVFGMGNAGAGLTSLFAPQLLRHFVGTLGTDGWRAVPRVYAAALCISAVLFFVCTQSRNTTAAMRSLREQFAPLRDVVVWRFGLYYLLVFGGFIAVSQWLLPYSLNVYGLSVAGAGMVAAVFSFPSGLIRAAGGWLSDRYGARPVMSWVFVACVVSCAVLCIPKMDIASPGEGVLAKAPGTVTEVSAEHIRVGATMYTLRAPPRDRRWNERGLAPQSRQWQVPTVRVGGQVVKQQLLARGTTHVFYPANFWLFIAMVFVFGVATGIGKASVYKFIPDQYPNAVGAVGGLVGLLGGLGGFIMPLCFGLLLRASGFWASCFWFLLALSLTCLLWMELVARRIVKAEAPDLARMMERSRESSLGTPIDLGAAGTAHSVEDVLRQVPFFAALSEEELKNLARIGTRQEIKRDEIIFNQGEPGETLYVLLRGSATVERHDPNGQNRTINTLRAGDHFGEIALIDGRSRTASVVARDTCELFLIGRSAFIVLLQRSPRILADILVGLSSKIRRIEERREQASP